MSTQRVSTQRVTGRLVRAPLTAGLVAATVAALWLFPTGRSSPPPRLVLTRDQLSTLAGPAGGDYGRLADPDLRAACLSRHGVGDPPLAGRQVLLDGHPGVLLVLPSSRPGRLRLLVVDDTCAATLADDTVGR